MGEKSGHNLKKYMVLYVLIMTKSYSKYPQYYIYSELQILTRYLKNETNQCSFILLIHTNFYKVSDYEKMYYTPFSKHFLNSFCELVGRYLKGIFKRYKNVFVTWVGRSEKQQISYSFRKIQSQL